MELLTQAPAPLVRGRDLIALGLMPSPHFQGIRGVVYDEQLEGRVSNGPLSISAQGIELHV